MIIHLKKSHSKNQLLDLEEKIKEKGCKPHTILGESLTTVSVIGDTSKLNVGEIQALDGVEFVTRVTKPFKLCSSESRTKPTTIQVGDLVIGGNNFLSMAGPCSIESEDQTMRIAHAVRKSGASVLRGGAFKPRSS
ncbi:MAG: hypothetical protein KDD50_12590, partial [Bdellovibrionales bacterium]|nr:hypothetical protein [Bdellovibrionales bacterium]